VQVVQEGRVQRYGGLIATLRTRAAFAWDAPMRRANQPEYSPLWARARAVWRDAQDEMRTWPAVPQPDDVAGPPQLQQLLQAEHPIYLAEQNAAVFLEDVHGSYGNLDIRADAAVLWVDPETGRYEIYAEGNVRLTPRRESGGPDVFGAFDAELQSLTADRIYVNPSQGRGLVDDPEVRIQQMDGPLYVMRGGKLFMLDSNTLTLEEASFTTCTFARPHYQISARRLQMTDTGTATPVAARDVRVQVGEGPTTLLWIPFLGLDVSRRSFIIRDLSFGSDDKFGAFLQTTWRPLDLMGGEPDWMEYFDLFLDFYSDRGFGIGQQLEYSLGRELPSEGLIRSYFIRDDADYDDTGLPVPEEDRGRFHWRHRTHLADSWRLDAEYYWLSDHGFREEFFEDEFEREKDPESYAQLRYLDNSTWAALRYRQRVNDFFTRVEQLPVAALEFMALPWGPLVYDGTLRAGRYDLELSDRIMPTPADPPELWRAHLDQRLSLPFDVAFLRFVPFVRAVATWADEGQISPGVYGGEAERLLAGGGAEVSARFWRTFDAESGLLDINRLRHIATPYVRAEHLSALEEGSGEFIQMDGTDALDEMTELRMGLRNRLQTRRLDADGRWRSVDWMALDVAYVDRESDSVNPLLEDEYIRADFDWQLTDRLALHSRDNRISLNDRTDIYNVGVDVDFTPAIAFSLDYDHLTDLAETLKAEMTVRLSDHYELMVYELYQFDSATGDSDSLETHVVLRRLMHEWLLELGLTMEQGNDDNVGIVFGFGPRGWGIFRGPRRSPL
jgi:hypothetical protein